MRDFAGFEKFAICLLALTLPVVCDAASRDENLRTIKSIDKNGQNHAAARAAVNELSQSSADSLPVLLKSFEGANPLAVNWLRCCRHDRRT